MYATRSMRKRLDALIRSSDRSPDRSPGRTVSCVREPKPIRYGRSLPRIRKQAAVSAQAPGKLTELVPGEEVTAPNGGVALLVRGRYPLPLEPGPPVVEGTLFFDIEATGLTALPLFLIGVMDRRDDELETRLYLARDYSEEAAVVSFFTREAAAATHLVSFNGKSYDLPFIQTRSAYHLQGWVKPDSLPHTDLLHVSRRIWGKGLPNCRLGTLEKMVLGRPRSGDIPGAEIPEAYHAFVRTGDATDLARIMEHNRLDLVSLAHLLVLSG